MSKRGLDDSNPYLKIYYDRFFPFEQMHKWLSLCGTRPFPNREFSFTFGEDIYVRYQSFPGADEFAAAVRDRCPNKIDIGAEFSFAPKDHNSIALGEFVPREKELVFDIDMTDYDDVRTCCKDAKVCRKCWQFMVVAVLTLERVLDQAFGLDNRMWVFSGRRGVHCWVSDPVARALTVDARGAIADFMSVRDKLAFNPKFMHPMLHDLYESILLPQFVDMIETQQWFSDVAHFRKILDRLEDKETAAALADKWGKEDNAGVNVAGTVRWKELVSAVKPHSVVDIVFAYVFPKLDANVSKGVNHLLKAPFSVHPKTGKVCVPFEPKSVHLFNPDEVCTVEQLQQELDRYEATHRSDSSSTSDVKDYQKTSIRPAVELLEKYVTDIAKRIQLERKRADLSF
jgi:DNA primase small subunit